MVVSYGIKTFCDENINFSIRYDMKRSDNSYCFRKYDGPHKSNMRERNKKKFCKERQQERNSKYE
jgi:hypothetical protein